MKEISRAEFNRNIITSNPLVERLLARGGGLNRCVLRFQSTALIQWKIEKSKVHCNAPTCSCSVLGKRYDAQSQEKTHIFTPVMLNLFQHLTSLACNLFSDKILKRVQDDNLTMEGLLCFP